MRFFCPTCGAQAELAGVCTADATPLAAIAGDSMVGRRAGEFTLVDRLGAGAMGEVYRGVHVRSGGRVAVKVLRKGGGDQDVATRLAREALLLGKLRHPGVAEVYDLGLLEGRVYVAMQHIEGRPLDALIAAGPLPIVDACRIVGDLLAALAAAHERGIVHRDLKPENVMIRPDRSVVLIDFGVAHCADEVTRLTRTGSLLGTPAYMAPEQVRGKATDARTDLYAVGVVLYEALVGDKPFAADTPFNAMAAHVDEPAPAPSVRRPEVPAALDQIVLSAMAKDPGARYQTALEMREALRQARPGRGVFESADSTVPTTRSVDGLVPAPAPLAPDHAPTVRDRAGPGRGARARGLAVAAAALAAVVAIGFAVWPRQAPSSPAPVEPGVADLPPSCQRMRRVMAAMFACGATTDRAAAMAALRTTFFEAPRSEDLTLASICNMQTRTFLSLGKVLCPAQLAPGDADLTTLPPPGPADFVPPPQAMPSPDAAPPPVDAVPVRRDAGARPPPPRPRDAKPPTVTDHAAPVRDLPASCKRLRRVLAATFDCTAGTPEGAMLRELEDAIVRGTGKYGDEAQACDRTLQQMRVNLEPRCQESLQRADW